MWPNFPTDLRSLDPMILVVLGITVLFVATVFVLLIAQLVPWRRLSEAFNRNGWYAWGTALLIADLLFFAGIQFASMNEFMRLFFWVTYRDVTQTALFLLFIAGIVCLLIGIPSRRSQFGRFV
jgi:hypothetical protein